MRMLPKMVSSLAHIDVLRPCWGSDHLHIDETAHDWWRPTSVAGSAASRAWSGPAPVSRSYCVTTIHLPHLRRRSEVSFTTKLRSLLALWSKQARQRTAFRHLGALDDHILRDIGVERSLVVLATNAGVERLCPKAVDPDNI
jgi:uncharacterized protein YjiS (DUF1127 family)